MTNRAFLTAVMVLIVAVVVAAQQPTTFHADARLVVLQVTVTNKHGELVPTLDREAFTVYENGRQQQITIFRRDDVPISLGLIIDNSQSMRPVRASVEAAALAFVRASNPLDEAFVLNFADTARLDVPFTKEARVLEAGITRVDSIGGTAVRDAIVAAEEYLRDHATYDRRGLLVITDGKDNASSISSTQLRRVAELGGAAIFALNLVHGGGANGGKPDDELEELARVTGGALWRATSTSDMYGVAVAMARQIRNAYTIAYTPINQALDGSYRSIRVKVSGSPGSVARARPGYWPTIAPAAVRSCPRRFQS